MQCCFFFIITVNVLNWFTSLGLCVENSTYYGLGVDVLWLVGY